jgi:carboxylate-amine ligase
MVRKLGVEEELMLVDPGTGRLTGRAEQAVRAGDDEEPEVERELFRQQIETMTEPCETIDDLLSQLRAGRRAVTDSAAEAGAAAIAVPTPVLGDEDETVTPKPRYEQIREEYGELARTSLACAMHIHVDADDDEQGVRVLDGLRPWLPVLLAVSANSPYVRGRDTGYASWRAQIWSRWPSHGSPEAFGSPATYHEVRETLTEWGAAIDDGMVYFDARLSAKYPTVEIRVADVCTDLDDAVLLAALARGLVTQLAASGPAAAWRSDLIRAASWRASRYGLTDRLVHPLERRLAPAREVVDALVAFVRPALEDAGDLDLVEDLGKRIHSDGGGATRQRQVFEQSESLEDVVRDLVARTEASGAVTPGRAGRPPA